MIEKTNFQGIPYVIYIPDQFKHIEHLPLIVLFRGHPDEWFNPKEDSSRGKRTVFTIIWDMISKGFLEPSAFLFPCTCSVDRQEFYFADNIHFPDLRTSKDPVLSQPLFEQAFLPHIQQKYGVDIKRVSLDGFSLGGYTSLAYSFLNPGRYASTGSFDGSILDYEYDNRTISPDTPSDVTFDQFPYLFGNNPESEFFRSKNPMDLVINAQKAPDNLFIMASNDKKPESNLLRVLQFTENMKSKSIKNHAEQLLIDEDSRHEWYWVDEYLYRALPFHSKILNGKPLTASSQ
jgi:hypothetical protein